MVRAKRVIGDRKLAFGIYLRICEKEQVGVVGVTGLGYFIAFLSTNY